MRFVDTSQRFARVPPARPAPSEQPDTSRTRENGRAAGHDRRSLKPRPARVLRRRRPFNSSSRRLAHASREVSSLARHPLRHRVLLVWVRERGQHSRRVARGDEGFEQRPLGAELGLRHEQLHSSARPALPTVKPQRVGSKGLGDTLHGVSSRPRPTQTCCIGAALQLARFSGNNDVVAMLRAAADRSSDSPQLSTTTGGLEL